MQSTDAVALKKRLLACYGAWDTLDIDCVEPFYSKNPDLLVFNDVEPVQFEGWNEFRDGEMKVMARMSKRRLNPKHVKASVWGGVGVTTATPVLTGDSKAGKHYELTLRHTAVWERRGRRWLIIHEHWSIPWPSSD